jgi:endo-1,4-beta-mannosidase
MPASEIGRRRILAAGAASAAALGLVPSRALASTRQPPTSRAASKPLEGRHRNRRVRMGVNYVPTRSWWYAWADWDARSIRRDLRDITDLGLDHIRIQLLWPDFQPNASYVRGEMVDRLEEMLDLAGEAGLQAEVTVLDGQLSGFLFTPAWLIQGGSQPVKDFMTDPGLIADQQFLFTTLAKRIGAHPAFLGFDIANEIFWYALPFGIQPSPQQGDAWMTALLSACEQAAPGKLHVNGVDKQPYLYDEPFFFTRQALATTGGATVTHPWEGYVEIFQNYGPLSTTATHFTEYLIQYMQAFSQDLSRQVWIEEDGSTKYWMPEQDIPVWEEAMIRNAVTCGNLFAITWWCSHDPSTRFTGFAPQEYTFGLYTNDHKLKPSGEKMLQLVRDFDAHPPAVLPRPEAVVIPDSMGAMTALDRYMKLVDSGTRAAVVLQSRADDKAYLQARGITTLIPVDQIT